MKVEDFLQMAELLPEAAFLITEDGVIIAGNGAATELARLSAASLSGARLCELVAEPAETVARYLRLCARNRCCVPGSLTWRGRSGVGQTVNSPDIPGEELIECRCDGARLELETETASAFIFLRCRPKETTLSSFRALNEQIAVLSREVAERKRAEEAMRESQALFQQLFESAPDAIIVINSQRQIVQLNVQAESLFGYHREELLGQVVEVLIPEHLRERHVKHSEDYLATPYLRRLSVGLQLYGRRKDGSQFPADIALNPLRTASDLLVLCIIRDITERKQVEETLFRREQEFRALVENSPYIISRLDRDLRYLYVNPAVERMSGRPPQAYLGRTRAEAGLPKKLCQDLDQKCREVFETGEERSLVFSFQHLQGPRHCYCRIVPEWGPDGTVASVLNIVYDITERWQAEEMLRQSEERYRTIIEEMADGYWELDLAGNYTFVNPQVMKIHRRSREELLGLNSLRCVDEKTAKRLVKLAKQVYLTGEAARGVTYEIIRADGTRCTVEANISLIRDAEGKPVGFRGVSRDVTERLRMEEELRNSQALYRSLVEGLPLSLLVKDREGRFITANQQALAVMQKSQEEIVGRTDWELFPADLAEKYRRDDLQVMQEGKILRCIEQHQKPDGERIYVEVLKTPVKDAKGAIVGVQVVFWDVTERVNYQEQLRIAKEAAEAASRTKSEFLANMSHEIRTPMNGIIGMTELALDTDLTREQREYLTMIKSSADSLLTVINDILDFSKIEAGKLDLDLVEFHLHDELGDMMKMLALRAHQKGLELVYAIQPEVPEVLLGDPDRLRQVLVNLIGNAIKFTEQGEVVLRVVLESQTEDQVYLHFVVTDTGIGIPPEKQRAIFEAFVQADGSTTRRYGGTGLGLTISSRLVEIMGGRIWVESPLYGAISSGNGSNRPESPLGGPGSAFHFTARFGWRSGALARPRPASPTGLQGLRVLVVDDNATNRCILKEILTNWQMLPTTSNSAPAGLQALEQAQAAGEPFALLLLDVHMPEVDGFTLVEQIRQRRELAETKIVMLTSASQRDDAARCRQLGIAVYLSKPIRQSELLEAISAALGTSPQTESLLPVERHTLRESQRRLNILLVEDNSVNQRLMVRLLEKQGHHVVVAGNGHEALAALERESFDLVLMDVQMPEMDGFEATAAIRQREQATGTHIPILAMTAHAMAGDRERCLKAGMDGYVCKPVQIQALLAAIESVVNVRAEEEVTSR